MKLELYLTPLFVEFNPHFVYLFAEKFSFHNPALGGQIIPHVA